LGAGRVGVLRRRLGAQRAVGTREGLSGHGTRATAIQQRARAAGSRDAGRHDQKPSFQLPRCHESGGSHVESRGRHVRPDGPATLSVSVGVETASSRCSRTIAERGDEMEPPGLTHLLVLFVDRDTGRAAHKRAGAGRLRCRADATFRSPPWSITIPRAGTCRVAVSRCSGDCRVGGFNGPRGRMRMGWAWAEPKGDREWAWPDHEFHHTDVLGGS